MRAYKILRQAGVTRDLDLIAEHLVRSYTAFGEDAEEAEARAAARVLEALAYMRTFETHPHRGTEAPEVSSGLRHDTHRRFVLYFEVDEPASEVRILAVFFGGADHRQQVVDRLRH